MRGSNVVCPCRPSIKVYRVLDLKGRSDAARPKIIAEHSQWHVPGVSNAAEAAWRTPVRTQRRRRGARAPAEEKRGCGHLIP